MRRIPVPMLETFAQASALLLALDPSVAGIAALSLRVSLAATAIGCAVGIPAGAFLAIARFPGRGGAIVNTASVAGLSGGCGPLAYSAAKAAVVNLSKAAAVQLAPDRIRVNAICPGLIKTKFSEALWSNDKILQHTLRQLPIKRIGTPEEIGATALYLAAPGASYTTGAVITADGGLTI